MTTAYRGVKFVQQGGDGTFCYRGQLTASEAIMQALQVASLGSILSIAFLVYISHSCKVRYAGRSDLPLPKEIRQMG